MLLEIFFHPKSDRLCAIITYKHGIYELPIDLMDEDLRKLGNIRNVSKLDRMIA